MPDDAEYYSLEGKEKIFWKTCRAFNMKLLEYWDGYKWQMKFGRLPWNDLIPLNPVVNYEI